MTWLESGIQVIFIHCRIQFISRIFLHAILWLLMQDLCGGVFCLLASQVLMSDGIIKLVFSKHCCRVLRWGDPTSICPVLKKLWCSSGRTLDITCWLCRHGYSRGTIFSASAKIFSFAMSHRFTEGSEATRAMSLVL